MYEASNKYAVFILVIRPILHIKRCFIRIVSPICSILYAFIWAYDTYWHNTTYKLPNRLQQPYLYEFVGLRQNVSITQINVYKYAHLDV